MRPSRRGRSTGGGVVVSKRREPPVRSTGGRRAPVDGSLYADHTSVSSSRSNSQSSAAIGNWSNGDFRCSISFNVFNPQIATSTTYQTNSYASLGGFNSAFLKLFAGNQSSTTQFDGFEVSTLSGTMTGTIKVYGYK